MHVALSTLIINRQMLPEFKAETLNYLQVQCPCQFQHKLEITGTVPFNQIS